MSTKRGSKEGMAARRFADRRQAGRLLGARLAEEARDLTVVLGLPRGGVPVGFEVARQMEAPLDVFVARKIGAPDQPELGIGAIAEGGPPLFDDRTLRYLQLDAGDLRDIVAAERQELARRVEHYRGGRDLVDVAAHTVFVVDDGLATGVTARAALTALRERGPRRLVFAAPTCAAESSKRLADVADDVVCLQIPENFRAVGEWYLDFGQTTDDEVVQLLERARRELPLD